MINPDARHTVVQRDGEGYRTTPTLRPMTVVEALERAAALKCQYPHQTYVVLSEVGETVRDDTVSIRRIGEPQDDPDDVILRFPTRLRSIGL